MKTQKLKTRYFGPFSPGQAPSNLHYSAHRWNFEKSDTFPGRKRPPLSIETTFETVSITRVIVIRDRKIRVFSEALFGLSTKIMFSGEDLMINIQKSRRRINPIKRYKRK